MVTTATGTAWKHGRFDARRGASRVLFGRMYEDPSVELAAFPDGGRIFCIASAGCTAMRLATRHEVVAVDINPTQLAYAARRIAGDRCRPGAAERVMGLGRRFAPILGWRRSRVRAFLSLDDTEQQIQFWRQHLDTRRFRIALDGLFSVTALRRIYASSFLDFLPQHLGRVMRGRMERCFRRHPNRSNRFARALLQGDLPSEPLPPEGKTIHLAHADAAAYLEDVPAGSFDGFTLSNILDGASATYEKRLLAAVEHAASPGAVLVLRSFREPKGALPTNHAADDRAMLWGIVDVRPIADLGSQRADMAGVHEGSSIR